MTPGRTLLVTDRDRPRLMRLSSPAPPPSFSVMRVSMRPYASEKPWALDQPNPSRTSEQPHSRSSSGRRCSA